MDQVEIVLVQYGMVFFEIFIDVYFIQRVLSQDSDFRVLQDQFCQKKTNNFITIRPILHLWIGLIKINIFLRGDPLGMIWEDTQFILTHFITYQYYAFTGTPLRYSQVLETNYMINLKFHVFLMALIFFWHNLSITSILPWQNHLEIPKGPKN